MRNSFPIVPPKVLCLICLRIDARFGDSLDSGVVAELFHAIHESLSIALLREVLDGDPHGYFTGCFPPLYLLYPPWQFPDFLICILSRFPHWNFNQELRPLGNRIDLFTRPLFPGHPIIGDQLSSLSLYVFGRRIEEAEQAAQKVTQTRLVPALPTRRFSLCDKFVVRMLS